MESSKKKPNSIPFKLQSNGHAEKEQLQKKEDHETFLVVEICSRLLR